MKKNHASRLDNIIVIIGPRRHTVNIKMRYGTYIVFEKMYNETRKPNSYWTRNKLILIHQNTAVK